MPLPHPTHRRLPLFRPRPLPPLPVLLLVVLLLAAFPPPCSSVTGGGSVDQSLEQKLSFIVRVGRLGHPLTCTGSLVGDPARGPDTYRGGGTEWVLVPAHCLYDTQDIPAYKFLATSALRVFPNCMKGTGCLVSHAVEHVYHHPCFSGAANRGRDLGVHDVALLKLSAPLVGHTVLVMDGEEARIGEKVDVAQLYGWGATGYVGSSASSAAAPVALAAPRLQLAHVPLLTAEQCNATYVSTANASNNFTSVRVPSNVDFSAASQRHLCAGDGKEKGTGGCAGDAGSMLVQTVLDGHTLLLGMFLHSTPSKAEVSIAEAGYAAKVEAAELEALRTRADGTNGAGLLGTLSPHGMEGAGHCTGCCGNHLRGYAYLESYVDRSARRVVRTNGIPSHVYHEYDATHLGNANGVCEKRVRVNMPATPSYGGVFRQSPMGPVGISSSGAFIYNHLAQPLPGVPGLSPSFAAGVTEKNSFDTCGGHADATCQYHYHSLPMCIPKALAPASCEQVGWQFDGFEVKGFCQCGLRTCRSCYNHIAGTAGTLTSHYTYNESAFSAGLCDLDRANGMFRTNSTTQATGYVYVTTENYPFIMPGYMGATFAQLTPDSTVPSACLSAKSTAASTANATVDPFATVRDSERGEYEVTASTVTGELPTRAVALTATGTTATHAGLTVDYTPQWSTVHIDTGVQTPYDPAAAAAAAAKAATTTATFAAAARNSRCNEAGRYGLFLRMAHYKPWVEFVMERREKGTCAYGGGGGGGSLSPDWVAPTSPAPLKKLRQFAVTRAADFKRNNTSPVRADYTSDASHLSAINDWQMSSDAVFHQACSGTGRGTSTVGGHHECNLRSVVAEKEAPSAAAGSGSDVLEIYFYGIVGNVITLDAPIIVNKHVRIFGSPCASYQAFPFTCANTTLTYNTTNTDNRRVHMEAGDNTVVGGEGAAQGSILIRGNGFLGPLFVVADGTLELFDVTLEGANNGGDGGAVHVDRGTLAMARCTVRRNNANHGGGVVNRMGTVSILDR